LRHLSPSYRSGSHVSPRFPLLPLPLLRRRPVGHVRAAQAAPPAAARAAGRGRGAAAGRAAGSRPVRGRGDAHRRTGDAAAAPARQAGRAGPAGGRRRIPRRAQKRTPAAPRHRRLRADGGPPPPAAPRPVTGLDVIPAPPAARVPVRGGGTFPVRRIYCVGRNFADHAREMGAAAPASKAERGRPTFFLKPADAIVTGGEATYPPGTADLQHETELVVALGPDAPPGPLGRD